MDQFTPIGPDGDWLIGDDRLFVEANGLVPKLGDEWFLTFPWHCHYDCGALMVILTLVSTIYPCGWFVVLSGKCVDE